MLKIQKNQLINDDLIECISVYNSDPLSTIAKKAKKNQTLREIRGRFGYNSILLLKDGYVFLCPNYPEVYFSKLDMDQYVLIDPKRYAIKKDIIREITAKPNKGQHEEIVAAKKEERYINLARNKEVRYYIFTTTNRIYGINIIRNMPETVFF